MEQFSFSSVVAIHVFNFLKLLHLWIFKRQRQKFSPHAESPRTLSSNYTLDNNAANIHLCHRWTTCFIATNLFFQKCNFRPKDIDLAKGVEKEASRKGNVFQRALKMGRKRHWWENVTSVGGKQCSLKDRFTHCHRQRGEGLGHAAEFSTVIQVKHWLPWHRLKASLGA